MNPKSAFVWRLRLSVLLLAFGSLIVEQERAIQAPAPDAAVASPSERAGVLTVKTPTVKRAASDRSPKRTDGRQRHVADARINATITPPHAH